MVRPSLECVCVIGIVHTSIKSDFESRRGSGVRHSIVSTTGLAWITGTFIGPSSTGWG
jgi:hypothetical protein